MGFDIDAYKETLGRLEGLAPEQQQFALGQIYPAGDNDGKFFQDYLHYLREQNTPEAMQAKLEVQNQFDERRMRAAAPYKFAFDLPKQIAEGFGAQSALNVLGARNTVDAMNQTLASYPKMGFSMTPFQPRTYLS